MYKDILTITKHLVFVMITLLVVIGKVEPANDFWAGAAYLTYIISNIIADLKR